MQADRTGTSPPGEKQSFDSKTLIKSSIIIFIGANVSGLFMVLTRILLGRALGPSGFGTVSTMWAFGTTLGVLPVAGIAPAVTRFLALYWNNKQVGLAKGLGYVTAAWSSGLAALLALLALAGSSLLARYWLHDPSLAPLVAIASFGIPAWAAIHWLIAVFRGFGQTVPTVFIRDILRPILLVLILLPGWYWGTVGIGDGVSAYVISSGVAALIGLATVLPLFFRRTHGYKLQTAVGPWFRFSWPLTLSMLLQQVAGRSLDVLVLAYLADAGQVGIYASANTLVAIAGLLIQGVNYLALPLFVAGKDQQDGGPIRQARTIMFHFGIPLFLAMALWPADISRVTFGKEYADSAFIIPILAFGIFFSCFVGPLGQLLIAEGRARWHLIADIVSVATFMVFAWTLGPIWGAIGAAIARAISQVAFESVAMQRLIRLKKYTLWDWTIFGGIVPMVIPLLAAKAGAVLAVRLFHPQGESIVAVGFLAAAMGLVYLRLLRKHGLRLQSFFNKQDRA